MSKRIVGISIAVLAAAAVTGCDVARPAPTLPADAFVSNHPAVGSEAGQGIDHSGQLVYDAQHRPTQEAPESTHISNVVRDAVKSPEETALAPNKSDFPSPELSAIAAPTSQQAKGVTTGQFMWVGTVLATVNGEPVYADKVLSTLDRALKAEAKTDNQKHFQEVADGLIATQIKEFVDNDLEYAAAKQALDKKDEQLARFVTTQWRTEQKNNAGGSEALARQKAAEDGIDFEELVQQQYRLNMVRLYYQNKIFPQIKISAQDMRNYYQLHIRQYQQATAAKFRVIFVAADSPGNRDSALAKATSIYERAKGGEDFAKLAADPAINDDAASVRKKGAVGDAGADGWMEKDAYVNEKVEQAVWQLHPGEVSTPIPAADGRRDGFWIAKLDEIRGGQGKPFENEQVQDSIREVLRREQFARLRDEHRMKLIHEAIITENKDVRDVMMEMVMQRYKTWTGQ